MIKLYGSLTSPFVRHCRIALEQENIPFEFVVVDYTNTATQTPTQKMPYLISDQLQLTDSSSILKFIRENAQHSFLQDIHDYERFTLANTVLDSAINLFLMEKEGLFPQNNQYLKRQASRVQSSLLALDNSVDPQLAMTEDSHIRIACLMDWLIYRDRADTSPYQTLNALLDQAKKNETFQSTSPPSL